MESALVELCESVEGLERKKRLTLHEHTGDLTEEVVIRGGAAA